MAKHRGGLQRRGLAFLHNRIEGCEILKSRRGRKLQKTIHRVCLKPVPPNPPLQFEKMTAANVRWCYIVIRLAWICLRLRCNNLRTQVSHKERVPASALHPPDVTGFHCRSTDCCFVARIANQSAKSELAVRRCGLSAAGNQPAVMTVIPSPQASSG